MTWKDILKEDKPLHEEVQDISEDLEKLHEKLQHHDKSSAEFKTLHRKMGQQIRELKSQRRKQKQGEK